MKNTVLFLLLSISELCHACTGFGFITDHGTIIGRNRDYYYNPQKFELMQPIQQFNNWYENNYHHNNKFYALTSKNNVSMGVNQMGLTIIEEDSPLPIDAKENRRFQQPENGTAEGMIKYGILQNFNTIDEITPFLTKIFSVADPHFYQIADAKKILIVEVAYGENNADPKRKFSYKILSKKNEYFAHTNLYLTPEFVSLNKFKSDKNSFYSATERLRRITELLLNSKFKNNDVAIKWLMDTHSSISANPEDKNGCLNTSLFRSHLQQFKSVDVNAGNDKIYGTVSSMVVDHRNDLKKSSFYLMMVNAVVVHSNQQVIKYKELRTNLADLFETQKPVFVERQFVRSLPTNGICT